MAGIAEHVQFGAQAADAQREMGIDVVAGEGPRDFGPEIAVRAVAAQHLADQLDRIGRPEIDLHAEQRIELGAPVVADAARLRLVAREADVGVVGPGDAQRAESADREALVAGIRGRRAAEQAGCSEHRRRTQQARPAARQHV